MFPVVRVWTKLVFAATAAMIASVVPVDAPAAAAEPPTAQPAAPGAKPSKDRFSKAMKRLRDQRRNKAKREKAKARAKRAMATHSLSPDKGAKDKKPKTDNKSPEPRTALGSSQKIDLTVDAPVEKPSAPKAAAEPTRPKVHRPAPPLPEPKFTELERALQQSVELQVVDLGPDERWEVSVTNRSPARVRIAADPRLLSFEARVPGKAKPVSCKLPEALLPKSSHVERETLAPGERYTFTIDPLMYCFETGDQTILVPGTFLTASYGFTEKTQTRWSWGRRYEERLTQVAPFAARFAISDAPPGPAAPPPPPAPAETTLEDAEPVSPELEAGDTTAVSPPAPAPEEGLKRVVGNGFALRSEYQGWAHARLRHHSLGDAPQAGLKLSISSGSDAPSARDVSVTVRLDNISSVSQRVYFRRDLVSFVIKGPDGEHQCQAASAAFRAPEQQAFTTIAAGKSASFTTQLLEFCPAESFSRPGFYYVSAVLPGTATANAEEDVFTGKLAASKPRPVRLHRAELPFTIRRAGAGGGGGGSVQNSGRFSRSPVNPTVPEGEMIQPLPQMPEPPPPPPVEAPAPAIQ